MSEKYPNFFSIAKASDGSVWQTDSPDVRPVQIRAAGDSNIIRIPSVSVHIPAGLTVSDAFKLSGVVGLHIGRLAVAHDGRTKYQFLASLVVRLYCAIRYGIF